MGAISSANSRESQPDANARAFRADDRKDLKDRRKPSIQLDQKPAIIVRQPNAVRHLSSQNNQLMSERRILCLKPTLRLEWRGQDGDDEAEQCDHYALTLSDSVSLSMRTRFSIHTGVSCGGNECFKHFCAPSPAPSAALPVDTIRCMRVNISCQLFCDR